MYLRYIYDISAFDFDSTSSRSSILLLFKLAKCFIAEFKVSIPCNTITESLLSLFLIWKILKHYNGMQQKRLWNIRREGFLSTKTNSARLAVMMKKSHNSRNCSNYYSCPIPVPTGNIRWAHEVEPKIRDSPTKGFCSTSKSQRCQFFQQQFCMVLQKCRNTQDNISPCM